MTNILKGETLKIYQNQSAGSVKVGTSQIQLCSFWLFCSI